MKWEELNKNIRLSIDGLGIVFYSDGAVKDIPIGEDYLEKEFMDPQKVAAHVRKGDIVGVCTEGDSYEFEIRFRGGLPDDEIREKYPASLRLAIEVSGGALNVIDLYWLMKWQNDCPAGQRVEIEPGFYQMTLCAEPPLRAVEGLLGEEDLDIYIERPRVVYVFLDRLDAMPEVEWSGGVPDIYEAYPDE